MTSGRSIHVGSPRSLVKVSTVPWSVGGFDGTCTLTVLATPDPSDGGGDERLPVRRRSLRVAPRHSFTGTESLTHFLTCSVFHVYLVSPVPPRAPRPSSCPPSLLVLPVSHLEDPTLVTWTMSGRRGRSRWVLVSRCTILGSKGRKGSTHPQPGRSVRVGS